MHLQALSSVLFLWHQLFNVYPMLLLCEKLFISQNNSTCMTKRIFLILFLSLLFLSGCTPGESSSSETPIVNQKEDAAPIEVAVQDHETLQEIDSQQVANEEMKQTSEDTIICSSNTYNCDDFSNWNEANNVYQECGGQNNDIHRLDSDGNDIPCESLNGAPAKETTEEETNSINSKSYICSTDTYNCGDFLSYSEALAAYEACGGLSNDVHDLDRDHDGKQCESLK